MSQDKVLCSINITDGSIFGYFGNQPELKEGKKSLYTQFNFYNKYLPAGLNPIKVSAFGELAEKICSEAKKGLSARIVFNRMAFGEVVNTQTNQTRPGIYLTLTSCIIPVASKDTASEENA